MTRTGTGLGVMWLAWTASACDPGVAAASRLTFRPPDGVEIVELHTSALLPAEDSFSIGRAAALLQIGDYLVVGDRRGDPHIIVYDLARGVPIQRLGRSGRGPGEIADPSSLRRRFGTNDTVQLFDGGQRRLAIYSVGSNGLRFVRHEATGRAGSTAC
jgi:hypothetical protein